MNEYTKGEWIAGYNPGVTGPTTPTPQPVCGHDWPYRTINIGTETIAIVPAQDSNRTREPNLVEMEANARLIASAPDLYEALKKLPERKDMLAEAAYTGGDIPKTWIRDRGNWTSGYNKALEDVAKLREQAIAKVEDK